MDKSKMVPVYTGPLDAFPASDELPEGTKSVSWTDEPGCIVDFNLDVVYDKRDGMKLHLHILLPLEGVFLFGAPIDKRYPLIMHVPGSAWRKQDTKMFIGRCARYCERGYAVAIVEYRPSDIAPFPAQIEDLKTAVRFMRKNADLYKIDPDRVAFIGDSSGGHTVAMAGITGDGVLDNGTYGEFSSEAKCVVNCFGPSDVSRMAYFPSMMDHTGRDTPEGMLLGGVDVHERIDLAEKAAPMYYLSKDKATPPMIILHGDQDSVVPFNQSVLLYDKMRELGKDVTLYKLLSGTHGLGGFGSTEARDTILGFIESHIG